MTANCRNCKKTFNAKNALFCSTNCYKMYTDAIERNEIVPLEDDVCNHEYTKNGAMSCRKCGAAASVLIK